MREMNGKRKAIPGGSRRPCGGLASAMIAAALGAMVAGCTQVSYSTGSFAGQAAATAGAASKRPDMKVLEGRLKLGASSKQEVLDALGKPTGDGGTFLAVDPKPRETWTYYYEEGTVRLDQPATFETRRTFLFVYFDGGRYDGYMWFSSLP
jgi:hypothetical protein